MIARLGDKEIVRAYQGENVIYPTPIRDGLVLWYDFKGKKNTDAIKNIAEDLSGNGNNGELQNFGYTEGSGYNQGLEFDGIDDRVNTNLVFDISDKEAFTLSASVKNKDNDLGAINILGTAYYQFLLYQTGTNVSFTAWNQAGGNVVHVSVPLFTSEPKWHSVAVTYQNNMCVLYIDGKLRRSAVSTGIPFIKRQDFLYVGYGYRFDYGNAYYDGEIGSVHIYDKALTDEEIQYNYQIEKARWGL